MTIRSFDIETFEDNNTLVPYCVSFCWNDKKNTFYGKKCIDDFLTFAFNISKELYKNKKSNTLYIFSHNLTFDGSIIIQNISNASEIKFDGVLFKGTIFSLSLKKKECSLTFKCSYKFFPAGLDKACKMLDTWSKSDFDHNKITNLNYLDFKEECQLYCTNDSIIVLQIMYEYAKILENFNKDWLISTNSIPAASLKIYEKCFNTYGVDTCTNSDFDETFRPAYYGGRCEVFGNAEELEEVYHFDFTGMYAQVMLEDFGFGEYEIINNPKEIKNNGFYHISYKSEMYIPVLPHHSENGRLMFTNGSDLSGLYWWEEIQMFLKCGGIIKKINYQIRFKRNAKIFEDFVKTFTELRKKDKKHNMICKSIINSLYGRLGMSPLNEKTKIMSIDEFNIIKKKYEDDIISETHINNIVIAEIKKIRNYNVSANVSIAAIIASKARVKLMQGFIDVSENGGRVLYTDTDSIFASFKKKVDNMTFGEVFFDMSKKDTKIHKSIFAATKAYAIINDSGAVVKIKGVKRDAISYENFKTNFEKENNIKFNVSVLRKSNYIITPDTIDKIISLNNYEKRIFDDSKKYTLPVYIKKNGTHEVSKRGPILNNKTTNKVFEKSIPKTAIWSKKNTTIS